VWTRHLQCMMKLRKNNSFKERPNNGCVEVVVICCTGHGNGKFFKYNAFNLWRTAETKLASSVTAYSHKTLLKDKPAPGILLKHKSQLKL